MNNFLIAVFGGVFFGVICGVAGMILIGFIFNAFINPFRRKNIFLKGREEGRVVVGKLKDVKLYTDTISKGGFKKNYKAIYDCEYNGKRIKFTYYTLSHPEDEMEVFISENGKALAYNQIGEITKMQRLLVFVVIFVIVFIIAFIKLKLQFS